MHQKRDEINALNTKVVGISYDAVKILKSFSESQELSFPLLSDAGSKTIKAYELEYQKGLPHPITLVVDSKRRVVARLSRSGYRDRHSADELIETLEALKK